MIRKYGLLHPNGGHGQDIALDATLFIDGKGVERWREVSQTLPDLPTADEVLTRIRQEIDAVELRPDEADLERWLENQLSSTPTSLQLTIFAMTGSFERFPDFLSRGLLDLVQVSTQNESEQKERERLSACLDCDFIARGETVEDVLKENLGPCRAMS